MKRQSTDGFFYYQEDVTPEQELKMANNNPLFSSYTAHDVPFSGAQFRMDILVQAISYDGTKTYKTVWE